METKVKNLLHSLGLVYKSMRGMVTNSIDRDQWLNVTSESRDRIWPFFFLIILNFALGRNQTRDPRVPKPKRTPYCDINKSLFNVQVIMHFTLFLSYIIAYDTAVLSDLHEDYHN
jgi:hypothetical protein